MEDQEATGRGNICMWEQEVARYTMINDNVCDKIVKFKIDARVNSDHLALEEGTVIENDAEEDSVIKEEKINYMKGRP